jgi:metallophosphoesterase superfamily enzyme
MQIPISDEITLDSRRALWMPKSGTLVVADLFLGLGAARRKKPDLLPAGQHNELWERLLGLVSDLAPARVAVLGDIKPNQGSLEGEEAEELRGVIHKLRGRGRREVIQVVGHPERAWGPALEGTGLQPVETWRVGIHTLMHRRRVFVYPRHEPREGHWINGGLHPLFVEPQTGPDHGEAWARHPAFLFTGYALVMPPFVGYAQGWEVIQPDRLPKQARAWKLLGARLLPLDLPALPLAPEALRSLARPSRTRPRSAPAGEE